MLGCGAPGRLLGPGGPKLEPLTLESSQKGRGLEALPADTSPGTRGC